MRRFALSVFVVNLALAGCNRGPTIVVPPMPAPPAPPVAQAALPIAPAFPTLDLSPQDRYDAAVWTAFTLLTDRKYAEAITALEQAQRVQNADQIGQAIVQVKHRLDAAQAADRTARDIRTVLSDGSPDEAARLATAALREFGATEMADAVMRLKRQADALVAVSLDGPARVVRFRLEADEATRANDLRAAALAYEQCAAAGDAAAQPRFAAVQSRLDQYDDARRRAFELRRASGQVEEALATLKTAAAAWDTPQIRQEIDERTLALQSRHERLSVAEFEARGDGGEPLFGQTIAEEMLPAFKARFDVVEGGPVAKVLSDLRLHAADVIDDETGRRELARLANIRYLVIGSATRLGNEIIVHARLVDLKTGLVVQTAKVAGATPTVVVALLPHLAVMLQMTDDQRFAYEQQLARQAAAIPVAAELTTIPPPPPPLAASVTGLPIICSTARSPDGGGVVIEDFRQLPPLPSPGQVAIGLQLAISQDHKVRARALSVAVELGDDLFRRGHYQEAHAQFQLALSLAPGQKDIQVRLDQCKPLLPPSVTGLQPMVAPPRLAALDFVTAGDPAVAPPGLGPWAAESTAAYLSPPYDVADRGAVCWYMSRLGISLRDAVVDPLARLYLGRALNVRFLVLGTVQATPAGLEVVAHLLDTETGAELNTATAVARDHDELKCRLGEIARWLLLGPAERKQREVETAQAQTLLLQAEAAAKLSNFSLAIDLTKKAGHKTPGIRVEVLLNRFDRQARFAALDAKRRTAWSQSQAVAAAATRRQQALAAAAEAARIAAAKQADTIDIAERQRLRDLACQQLLVQARAANATQYFAVSLQLYDSALAIDRKSDAILERDKVVVRAADQARARTAVDALSREAALRQERAADTVRIRTQLDAERRQRAAAEQARRQAQDQTDAREGARLLVDAQRLLATGDTDSAVRALQTAKRLHPADEIDRLLAAALVQQARASAQQPNDPGHRDREAKLAAEATARAEVEAKRQADARAKADAEARIRTDAEAKRHADVKAKADVDARNKSEADAKTHVDAEAKQRADAEAARRLKQSQDAAKPSPPPPPPALKAPPEPPSSKPATAVRPPPAFEQWTQAGAELEKQERFGDALKAYETALRILSTDPAAIKRAQFAEHMDAGVTAMNAGRKPDAVRDFEAALKIAPNDPAATKWLQKARR
jgi:TolB-like protein